LITIPILLSPP